MKISASDVKSITKLEVAFGTTRHLPPVESIPPEFNSSSNPYVRTVSAIFAGTELPDGEIEIIEGVEPQELNQFIRAHLTSWEPKHEHKIAGVAYLLSQICTITPGSVEQTKEAAGERS